MKLILLTTSRWTKEWFKKLVLPFFQINYSIEFYDISCNTFSQNFVNLRELLKDPNVECLALFEDAMNLYSTLLEYINNRRGGDLYCFQLCSNKIAARSILDLNGICFKMITNDFKYFMLEKDYIFKPINGVSSNGIFKIKKNEITMNPYYKKFQVNEPLVINKLCKYKDIIDYFNHTLIGLIEEYVNPKYRKISVDGFIQNGKIYHYCISENVYKINDPEKFDYLLTPIKNITKKQINLVLELYDKIMNILVSKGLDNQFCDIEMFLIENNIHTNVKLMEVNCRAFSNQIPIFSQLYKEDSIIPISFKLLKNIPVNDYDYLNKNLNSKVFGMCFYKKHIKNVPNITSSNGISYYKVNDDLAHIYIIGKSIKNMKNEIEYYYNNLKLIY